MAVNSVMNNKVDVEMTASNNHLGIGRNNLQNVVHPH